MMQSNSTGEIKMRDGTTVTDPRLGRLIQFDERSRRYPVRTVLPDKPRRAYSWSGYPTLNQGTYECPVCHQKGACTGYSVVMEMVARPLAYRNMDDFAAHLIYHRAKQLDIWEGEAYEGSSVIAAVQAAIEHYHAYKGYRWAFSEDDLALMVGYKGPSIVGTWWYTGMFRPDSDGYLRPTGRRAGGHAYIISGYSLKKEGYYVPNSWGGEGAGFIHREDMARLLAEDGEACILTRSKQRPEAA